MDALVKVMADAAEKAARAVLRDFGELEQLQVSRKGPADFVTRADKASERIIVSALRRARPEFSFLAEESGIIAADEPKNDGVARIFVVDPIDGTNNFIHGLPHVSISIAALHDREIVAGAIYDITRHELFSARKGRGAWHDGRRMKVSGKHDRKDMLLTTGLPAMNLTYEDGRSLRSVHGRLFGDTEELFGTSRCLGSAALDLAYVAAGKSDGLWHLNLKSWDVAAGVLMVREAGGLVKTPLGDEFVVDTAGRKGAGIVAAQPSAIDDLLELIKPRLTNPQS